ncbi:MAG TPA: hypothetical protein VJN92_11100 [Candidatus Acidoferrum sp.]|nr:hypothetical protein [Candidatus Acidoferrum sp.]
MSPCQSAAAATWTQPGRKSRFLRLLFGRTSDDLRRQLRSSHPEIPPGYDSEDFHDLQRRLEMVAGALSNPRNIWLSHLGTAAFGVIEVGTQRLSVWEARLEILRRAINFLENR